MGAQPSLTVQKYGDVGQWVAAVCTEPDGRLDARQGAVLRLAEQLRNDRDKATDFLLTVLAEPRLRGADGANVFLRRLFEMGRVLREFDAPFFAAYLDLLAAFGGAARGTKDAVEAQVAAGVGVALACLLEMDCALYDAAAARTGTVAPPAAIDTRKLLELVLPLASRARFAADFASHGGMRLLNAVCSRLWVTAEVQALAVLVAAQLSAWTGFPWVMDAANAAVCGNLLMAPGVAQKDAATAVVANSLLFAESAGARTQAVDHLRNINIVAVLLTNLLAAAKAGDPAEARLLSPADPSGTLSLRRTDVPAGGSAGLLLNTLYALAELAREADLAAAVADRAMPVVHLLLHGTASCYEEVQASVRLLAHIVDASVAPGPSQPSGPSAEVLQGVLLALGKVVLEDREARAALHALGLATAAATVRSHRVQVLSSEYFLHVLAQLNHKSIGVAAETLILLEHLAADRDLLPKGPRDVLVQTIVARINQTLNGSRAWTQDEPVFFTGLWSVLYTLMFEERDMQVVVAYLDEEQLDPFLARRRYQLRRALRDYIYPIIRTARRGELRFRNEKATLLQRWYRFYSGRRSKALYTQQLELLTTYLYDMASLEEEWYQGMMAYRRHYLMKFV